MTKLDPPPLDPQRMLMHIVMATPDLALRSRPRRALWPWAVTALVIAAVAGAFL